MRYRRETIVIERVMMIGGEAVPVRFRVDITPDMLPFNLLKRALHNKSGVASMGNKSVRVERISRGE